MVVLFDVVVLSRTSAFDLIEDESFEERIADVDKTAPDSFVKLFYAFEPGHFVEKLMRNRLNNDFFFPLSCVHEDELDFGVNEAEFLNNIVGFLQEFFELCVQLNMPNGKVLEYVFDDDFCACISGSLSIGQLEVELPMA